MVFSLITKLVIILAPPLLPFPFDAMAILILKQFLPIETPILALIFKACIILNISCFKEGYFL